MKGLRNIQHSMSMVLTTRFHIWFIIKLLLQNATDIINKCNSFFIIKFIRNLLQNASGFFYKMRQL